MDAALLHELGEIKTHLEKLTSDISALNERIDKLQIIPEYGFYKGEHVEKIFGINSDTLGRMRKSGRIEYIEISDHSFRYRANQPLFKGEAATPVVKPRMNKLKKALQNQ